MTNKIKKDLKFWYDNFAERGLLQKKAQLKVVSENIISFQFNDRWNGGSMIEFNFISSDCFFSSEKLEDLFSIRECTYFDSRIFSPSYVKKNKLTTKNK